MKKILILILSSIFLMISCDENQNLTFDNVNGQTLNYFKNDSGTLQIPIGNGNSATMDIVFQVTTKSDNDRTITFSVDEDKTNAPDTMYGFSSFTATIPAGSYEGSIQMEGFYETILDNEDKTVTLKIVDTSTGYFDQEKEFQLTLQMYCPIPNDYFVGMYLIEQTSPYVDGPTLSDGSIVEVLIPDGASSTTRSFSTFNYPDYCNSSTMDFTFNLVCNNIIVDVMDTLCRCNDASNWFGPADMPTSYDLTSDDILYVTFTDDTQSDCGTPAQTTYKFTKQ